MTDEQWKTMVTKLINHNGGWVITGAPVGVKPGDHIPVQKPSGNIMGLVVATATLEDAIKEC